MSTAPDVRGLSVADATIALLSAGLALGTVGYAPYSGRPINTVTAQTPIGGINVPAGTAVNVFVTQLTKPLDPIRSVISQYANSPTILQLIANMDEYVRPRANLQNFYDFVWNVDTAQGFGLDIWGRIVDVGRLVVLPNDETTFGFANAAIPDDWKPFNAGTFYQGPSASQAYILPDNTYRVLILAKAMANIAATTAPALNRLVSNLFPGRGRTYVLDLGGMRMRWVFEFPLTLAEYAILTTSGVVPHPAGVGYDIIVIPADVFGFDEMPEALPFGSGTFYVPPGS